MIVVISQVRMKFSSPSRRLLPRTRFGGPTLEWVITTVQCPLPYREIFWKILDGVSF